MSRNGQSSNCGEEEEETTYLDSDEHNNQPSGFFSTRESDYNLSNIDYHMTKAPTSEYKKIVENIVQYNTKRFSYKYKTYMLVILYLLLLPNQEMLTNEHLPNIIVVGRVRITSAITIVTFST